MATVIPSRIPSGATKGEERLHQILGALPEDWVVYYEPLVDGTVPDFVILAPDLGVVVIEDKSWWPKTILSGDQEEVEIATEDGPKTVAHPERQARRYNFRLQEVASRVRYGARFLHQSGPHRGKLNFPVTHLVTLSNITRSQLEDPDRCLLPIFDQRNVITRDEMEQWQTLSEAELRQTFRGFFAHLWKIVRMTDEEVKAVRAIIHPEIAFEEAFSMQSLLDSPRPIHDQMEVLRALDVRQEETARSVGEGHRVLYGVAGSGKTVILLTRARLLAERKPEAKILIVCYNRELSLWIRDRVREYPQITALTFHGLSVRNGIPFSDQRSEQELGTLLTKTLQEGSKDTGAFDAILIDEAQDFEPNWFSALLHATKDPQNGDFLIVADGAQGLYQRSKLSWKALGIKAQGRTHSKCFDLDQNYRNSSEILALAETFAIRSDLEEESETGDAIQAIRVDPRRSVRSTGAAPLLFLRASMASETDVVVGLVERLVQGRWADKKMPALEPHEIAILYPGAGPRQRNLLRQLPERVWQQCGAGAIWKPENVTSGDKNNRVTIQTIHSSKGLQYRAVILLWAGFDGHWNHRPKGKFRSLLYVGMTRAESFLAITASGQSPYVRDIEHSPACRVFREEHRPGQTLPEARTMKAS